MKPTDRRTFLHTAAWGAMGLGLARAAHAAASDRPIVGVIGSGGMGSNHVRLLAERGDVEIAWLCDVDQGRLDDAVQTVVKAGKPAPRTAADLRHVLDDAEVDAVWIATPDHWHAPAALLAIDAGKHVYVEKPCCHNVREGRLLVEAVQRTGRVLQVGTQSRSSPTVREAIDRVLGGEIGEVLVAKAWNSQLRGSIGRMQPKAPPAGLDFDLWIGPAPSVEYRENLLPSVWRWWYDFGCGDMGNDGVHDIDVALWGFGATGHPSRVACAGSKSFFDDDQQFPDTQYAVFEYPAAGAGGRPKQFIFEQRIWSPYVQEGYENGAAFYGTNGMLVIGHSKGWRLYGPRNRLLAEREGGAELPPHHQNFLDAIRGLQPLNAPIEVGHRAATLVHLANISARVGRSLEFDVPTEQITSDAEAARMVRREYRAGHWAAPRGV
jgi:predicted dehydrogenase